MAENFTVDQKKAIEAESGTLLVAAAAGSGKTSVLTQRVIRKLTGENPVSPDSLLVVTFTRAAAAEMKDRVYKKISKMIASAPGFEKRSELEHIRSRLADMNVSTMDSFCMTVVKTYYHKLGIDAEIDIMDPGEAEILRRETVDGLLENLISQDKDRFELLSEAFSKKGTDSEIDDIILNISEFAQSEPEPEKWIDKLSESYNPDGDISVWANIIRSETDSRFDYLKALISDCAYLVGDVETEKDRSKLEKYFNYVSDCIKEYYEIPDVSWDDYSRRTIQICKNIDGERYPSVNKEAEINQVIATKRDFIKKTYIKKFYEPFVASEQEHREDMEALYPVVLALTKTVKEFDKTLLDIKKTKHCYEFGDIMHFALQLLYDGNAEDKKTEIAREYGNQFSEILIDEYQDTNAAQDALFRSLSKGDGENMFTVGDVKQSIYSFRLANPAIFNEKCDAYPYYDGKEIKSKILLKENFRCREGIVKAVNFVFSSLMSREAGGLDYDADASLNYGAKYYEEAGKKESPDVYFHLIDGAGNAADKLAAEAEYIAADIKNRLEKDSVLTPDGKLRPARPGDFAILVRNMSSTGETYKKVFEKYGLSVVSNKDGKLYDFAEIRLLLSMLKAIDNPGDNVAVTAVAMSQFFGFTPDDMALIKTALKNAGRKRTNIYAGANILAKAGNKKCSNLIDKLSYFRRLSEGEGVSALLRDIDAEFSFSDSCLAMESGEIRYNNIMLLIENAEAAEGRGMKTAGAYARYFDTLRDIDADMKSAASGGGENSVHLITVHNSKGLEYPFVYIANLTKEFNKNDLKDSVILSHDNGIGIKRRENDKLRCYNTLPYVALKLIKKRELYSEEMRIYYVALTRARENLIIVCSSDDAKKECADIESRLPASGPVPAQFIMNCSSPDRWFVAAFARHKNGRALRVNSHRWEENCGDAEITVGSLQEEQTAEEKTEEITVAADENLLEEITRRASYVYPRAEIASKLSRYTASGAEEQHFSKQKFTRKKPSFLNPDGALTGTEKGTATHAFMEFCDFESCLEDIEAEIERVRTDGKISDVQAKGLDRNAILGFVNSDVYKLIRDADEIYRERRFFVNIPLGDADASVPDEFKDEPVVIIGQLDMLIIKDGKATIIDYKTDKTESAQKLVERYRSQMQIYINAVELSTEIPVERCIIYSLNASDFAEIEI